MEDKQIGRRQLMQYSAASIVVAASAKAGADGLVPVTQEESQSDEIITNEVDVLVVGGGTAGTIATIGIEGDGFVQRNVASTDLVQIQHGGFGAVQRVDVHGEAPLMRHVAGRVHEPRFAAAPSRCSCWTHGTLRRSNRLHLIPPSRRFSAKNRAGSTRRSTR